MRVADSMWLSCSLALWLSGKPTSRVTEHCDKTHRRACRAMEKQGESFKQTSNDKQEAKLKVDKTYANDTGSQSLDVGNHHEVCARTRNQKAFKRRSNGAPLCNVCTMMRMTATTIKMTSLHASSHTLARLDLAIRAREKIKRTRENAWQFF